MRLTNKFCWIFFIGLLSCHSFQESPMEKTFTSRKNIIRSVLKSELVLNRAKGIVYDNDIPFTGISIDYYKNDSLAESIEYLNGIKNGKSLKYFDNGHLSFSSEYVNGIQEGITRSWWKNGNLRSEQFLVNGKGEGPQKQFYKSGRLFKKINLENGKEHGLQQSWRENGKLYNNYEARHGRIFGLKRASLCFSLENEEVVLQSQNE